VAEWQNRPLEPMYPLVFFDALRVKIREKGLVRNKAVYVALGVAPEGTKDILWAFGSRPRKAPNSGCASCPGANPVKNVRQYLSQNWLSSTVFENYDDRRRRTRRLAKAHRSAQNDHVSGMGDWAHVGQPL